MVWTAVNRIQRMVAKQAGDRELENELPVFFCFFFCLMKNFLDIFDVIFLNLCY